jgi:hypothetical protein
VPTAKVVGESWQTGRDQRPVRRLRSKLLLLGRSPMQLLPLLNQKDMNFGLLLGKFFLEGFCGAGAVLFDFGFKGPELLLIAQFALFCVAPQRDQEIRQIGDLLLELSNFKIGGIWGFHFRQQ